MSESEKPYKKMVTVVRGQNSDHREAVILALRPDAVQLDATGTPQPWVAMLPSEARVLAYKILLFVAEIEDGVPPGR